MRFIGRCCTWAVVLVGLLSLSDWADASALRVKSDASGAGTGATWADAFTTIQAAITAASVGDEIWVAEGTYTNSTQPVVTMKIGVKLYGGFSGSETALSERNWTAHPTIIDGGGAVQCAIGVSSAVLDGFTLENGFTDGNGAGMYNIYCQNLIVAHCIFTANSVSGSNNGGAGMFNRESSLTITDCRFTGNSGAFGGGMLNMDGSSPTISQCIFENNTASIDGGGMYNYNHATPVISNCTFTANVAAQYGGGIHNESESNAVITDCTFTNNTLTAPKNGGGIYNYNASPTITRCTFTGNHGNYGGGLANRYHADAVITDCVFMSNTSANHGGGMFNRDCSPIIKNCTFEENTGLYGGGMFNENVSIPLSEQQVIGCTFLKNHSTKSNGGGGGMYISGDGCRPVVEECLFDQNTAAYFAGAALSSSAHPQFLRCRINQNNASVLTGGIMGNNGDMTVENCLFTKNYCGSASAVGQDLYVTTGNTGYIRNSTFFTDRTGACTSFMCYRGTATVSNCIFQGKSAPIVQAEESTFTIEHSCIPGGYAGTGNIDVDPLFVDAANGDYRIQYNSSCIDTGVSAGAPANDILGADRPQGAGIDMGAYEYTGVSTWPTVGELTYGQALSDVSLSGGISDVSGTFSMENPTFQPAAGLYHGTMLFTPDNLVLYQIASKSVDITVNKLTPTINEWPTINPLAYGLPLSKAIVNGGSASAPGAFVFANPAYVPRAGASTVAMIFQPTDTTTYAEVNGMVPITVQKTTYTLDFDAYMSNANQSSLWDVARESDYLSPEFSLDPASADINGGFDISTLPIQLLPNGMLDSVELALISAIMENTALDLSATGGVTHALVADAWAKNYAQMYHDLGGGVGGPERLLNPEPNIIPDAEYLLTGMMTLGDSNDIAVLTALATLATTNSSIAALINDPNIVVPNTADYTLLPEYLAWNGDADGDGCSNLSEYSYYYPESGRDGYIAAALDPNQTPPACADIPKPLTAAIEGPTTVEVTEGAEHTFTAVVTGGIGSHHYQWFFESAAGEKVYATLTGETSSQLVLKNIMPAQAGSYKYQVWDDPNEIVESSPVVLVVSPKVPVVKGLMPLAFIALMMAVTGMGRLARRSRRS